MTDRRLAAGFVCAAVACASSQDAMVKWVSGSYPIHEVMLIRCAMAFLVVGGLALYQGARFAVAPALYPRVALRGAVMCSAYLAFVMAIVAMPIADAVAVYFTMPLFAALLAWPMLGERVPPHRWAAIMLGFGGVLLMNGFTHGVFDAAVLFALWSAVGYALGQLMGRSLSRDIAPVTLAFHQNLLYVAISLVLAAVFAVIDLPDDGKIIGFLSRPWAMPPVIELVMMAAVGALASAGMVLFTLAYKHGEASFVAPFEYTAMFWAVLFGLVIWGDSPGLAVMVGGAVVILAGLIMIAGDRRAARLALRSG